MRSAHKMFTSTGAFRELGPLVSPTVRGNYKTRRVESSSRGERIPRDWQRQRAHQTNGARRQTAIGCSRKEASVSASRPGEWRSSGAVSVPLFRETPCKRAPPPAGPLAFIEAFPASLLQPRRVKRVRAFICFSPVRRRRAPLSFPPAGGKKHVRRREHLAPPAVFPPRQRLSEASRCKCCGRNRSDANRPSRAGSGNAARAELGRPQACVPLVKKATPDAGLPRAPLVKASHVLLVEMSPRICRIRALMESARVQLASALFVE